MPEDKRFPLKFPPGVKRNGTEYQAKGRWIDSNLVRFLEDSVRPIGGWENLEENNADITFGATGVYKLAGQPADGDTVTIDGKTYTWQTTLTNVDGNVRIGPTVGVSIINLARAINLGSGASDGTGFYTDFSEYSTGSKPSDWSVTASSDDHWTVETEGGATGGQVLSHVNTGASVAILGWDVTNDSNKRHEVVARFKITATSGTPHNEGLTLRDDATGNLMHANFDSKLLATMGIHFGVTAIGSISHTFVLGTYVYVRFQVQGTDIKAKVWNGTAADEPASFGTEFSFAVDDTSGRIGVVADFNVTMIVDTFGASTGNTTLTSAPTTDVRYALATTLHPTVKAADSQGDTILATFKTAGLSGIGTATTATGSNGTWDSATMIGNVPRAMLGWRDDTNIHPQLAVGTTSRLYHFTQGTLLDITPEVFTEGAADSAFGVGAYGVGLYGVGSYGIGDAAQSTYVEAGTWSLDNFGKFLLAVHTTDGRLLKLTPSGTVVVAEALAPTNNDGIVVTAERYAMLLGANGDPRKVHWSDREDETFWDETDATKEAGFFTLPGEGVLMQGLRGKSETLLFTDQDLFAARFIGGVLVYGFPKVGSNCGTISRHAAVVLEGRAVWMGQKSFYQYDGYVKTLPSSVSDYVFKDFNFTQRSKVWAQTMSDFGEVWWYYPSATSMEPDRYVIWNYVENHWTTGTLTRTAGMDRAAFDFPMKADLSFIIDHERGGVRIGTPFLESGPIEFGNGERIIDADELIPDEATLAGQILGSVQARIFTRFHPTETEVEVAGSPFTLANPTSIRIAGRQVRVKIEESTAGDWRLGTLRLNVQQGSKR